MQTLIERIEAAQGPSRDLDREIYATQVEHPVWSNPNFRNYARYTSSVDAALRLLPKGWWPNTIQWRRGNEAPWVGLRNYEARKVDAKAPTLALAICAAAIKAREAQQ